MEIIKLDKTASTNSWVAENADSLPAPALVYALEQTDGRGQRGNRWEAQPGMNLTASLLIRPEGMEPARQFAISEAVALAVADFLECHGIEARVKWPNDIYAGDKKICGILIENSILGRTITRSVAGIGINVNQTLFLGDAPNPVSMSRLTGKTYRLGEMAAGLADALERRLTPEALHAGHHDEFLRRMWRADGAPHPFFDRKNGEEIMATISSVAPDGTLSLRLSSGEIRSYAFKEVEFLLNR